MFGMLLMPIHGLQSRKVDGALGVRSRTKGMIFVCAREDENFLQIIQLFLLGRKWKEVNVGCNGLLWNTAFSSN